jgi:hypothetical protein
MLPVAPAAASQIDLKVDLNPKAAATPAAASAPGSN